MTTFAELIAAARRGTLQPKAMQGLSGMQQLQLSQAMIEGASNRPSSTGGPARANDAVRGFVPPQLPDFDRMQVVPTTVSPMQSPAPAGRPGPAPAPNSPPPAFMPPQGLPDFNRLNPPVMSEGGRPVDEYRFPNAPREFVPPSGMQPPMPAMPAPPPVMSEGGRPVTEYRAPGAQPYGSLDQLETMQPGGVMMGGRPTFPTAPMFPGERHDGQTVTSYAPPPGITPNDGGLGEVPGSGSGLIDDLWREDRGVAPSGQPTRDQVQRNKPAAPEAPLPYSTPDVRPQAGPVAGAALSMPTPATRVTGTSGKPNVEATVDRANELNWVQRQAANLFGIDTPEERARAKTYLANWAVGMAHSDAGLGAFADANLAGIEGVNEEELRQLGIDMKTEDAAMRREETAYRRTRDAIGDQRDASRDSREARMDGYRIAEYQRAAEEERRKSQIEQQDPFYGTGLAGGDLSQKLQLRMMVEQAMPDATPEEIAAKVEELWLIQNPPKASSGLDLTALLGAGV